MPDPAAPHDGPALPARRAAKRLARRLFRRPYAVLDSLFARLGVVERTTAHLGGEVQALAARQAALADDARAALALGWDHVALVRRLARLEDRVEQLAAQLDAANLPEEAAPRARAS
jgi:outer membrane murein-binding lipoprotein Lpp